MPAQQTNVPPFVRQTEVSGFVRWTRVAHSHERDKLKGYVDFGEGALSRKEFLLGISSKWYEERHGRCTKIVIPKAQTSLSAVTAQVFPPAVVESSHGPKHSGAIQCGDPPLLPSTSILKDELAMKAKPKSVRRGHPSSEISTFNCRTEMLANHVNVILNRHSPLRSP